MVLLEFVQLLPKLGVLRERGVESAFDGPPHLLDETITREHLLLSVLREYTYYPVLALLLHCGDLLPVDISDDFQLLQKLGVISARRAESVLDGQTLPLARVTDKRLPMVSRESTYDLILALLPHGGELLLVDLLDVVEHLAEPSVLGAGCTESVLNGLTFLLRYVVSRRQRGRAERNDTHNFTLMDLLDVFQLLPGSSVHLALRPEFALEPIIGRIRRLECQMQIRILLPQPRNLGVGSGKFAGGQDPRRLCRSVSSAFHVEILAKAVVNACQVCDMIVG